MKYVHNRYEFPPNERKFMYAYKIQLGDCSKDGHNFSEDVIFETNHHKKDLVKAHKALLKKKINIQKICESYGENYVDSNMVKKLEKLGVVFDFSDTYEEDEDGMSYYINDDEIFELLMRLLKTQIPDLTWRVTSDQTEEIDEFKGIGYGAYGNY